MDLFGKTWRITLLSIIALEFISFCGYTTSWVNALGFFMVVSLVLAISIYKLEWGFLVLVAELLIGSKGYLFYFDLGGKTISIRIALWLIVLLAWLFKTIWTSIKTKQVIFNWRSSDNFYYFLVFFVFIILALVNGQIQQHNLANIFFDFNGWLYLALILPAYDLFVVKKKSIIPDLIQVFTAAILWLIFKSLVLVFLFSHDIGDMIFVVYSWIRTTGVGEITLIQGGFFRIFFQSHIYLLVAFLLCLVVLIRSGLLEKIKIKNFNQGQKFFIFYSIFITVFAINIINFSRSNWIGLVLSNLVLFLIILFRKKWQELFRFIWLSISAGILSALLILAVVNFPLFNPIGGFNTTKLLSDRATAFTDEAGASSRWSLLPPLWQAITKAPVLGKGFGATVTYRTSDPRILESNPDGIYTTYAFEWGWLDIWLKLGFLGLLAYLILLFKIYLIDVYQIAKKKFDDASVLVIALSLGMISLMAVNIFSPYLNHPLGFGYLVISSAIIERLRKR